MSFLCAGLNKKCEWFMNNFKVMKGFLRNFKKKFFIKFHKNFTRSDLDILRYLNPRISQWGNH